jgi:Ca2+-binding EF-hand superfamily protein
MGRGAGSPSPAADLAAAAQLQPVAATTSTYTYQMDVSSTWIFSRIHAKTTQVKTRMNRRLVYDNAHRKLRRVVNIIRLRNLSINVMMGAGQRAGLERYELENDTKVALSALRRIDSYLRRQKLETQSDQTLNLTRSADKGTPYQNAVVARAAGAIYDGMSAIHQLFDRIDEDNNGTLTVSEFRQGLQALGLYFEEAVMTVTMAYMDDSGDGVLDRAEFSEKLSKLMDAEASTPKVILNTFCQNLISSGKSVKEFFEEMDEDGSGWLDPVEFHAALLRIGIHCTEFAARAAMDELDVDGDRSLQLSELVDHLNEHQRQRRVFATTVLGNICDYVRKTNTSVVRVFSRVDADGSGDLDVIELQAALLKMGQDLSELEVEEVLSELSSEGGALEMSVSQFLDKITLYESERAADTEKCAKLFAQFDEDGSGQLDRLEVLKLAKEMGLGDQIEDEHCSLSLDILIEDIEHSRKADLEIGVYFAFACHS